eukprot:6189460-Pleurochrysis_carterae.AAC.1
MTRFFSLSAVPGERVSKPGRSQIVAGKVVLTCFVPVGFRDRGGFQPGCAGVNAEFKEELDAFDTHPMGDSFQVRVRLPWRNLGPVSIFSRSLRLPPLPLSKDECRRKRSAKSFRLHRFWLCFAVAIESRFR